MNMIITDRYIIFEMDPGDNEFIEEFLEHCTGSGVLFYQVWNRQDLLIRIDRSTINEQFIERFQVDLS